jgi:hypothetical protein
MNLRFLAALACGLPALAFAHDPVDAARIKAIAAAAATPPPAFVQPVTHAPLPQLMLHEDDRRLLQARWARSYLPQIGPLTPESISVRRDGLVVRYSFR